MRRLLPFALLAACGHPPAVVVPAPTVTPDPTGPHAEAIAAQVQPYLDAELVSGVVIGIVDGGHAEIYGFGKRADDAPDRPDGRTIFEIGSLTQVFTSILLADEVARGEVAYDTPLAQLLPLGVTAPTAEGQVITLEMLATHRSGLPSVPRSLTQRQLDADPYGGYDLDHLYADLVTGRLTAVPGTAVSYSSFGVGLLAVALERKAGTPWPDLITARVTGPLGMPDTRVAEPSTADARTAIGHNEDLAPAVPWHTDAMVGAAGLHSTARDLVALVQAELDAARGGKGPLADRLRATQEVRIPADPRSLGLGWWIEKDGRHWHNGASGGHHVFVAFDPAKGQGVVVLASTSTTLVDRLAGSILDVVAGNKPAPTQFPDASAFAPLVGRYRVGSVEANVELRGKRLYLVQANQAPTRLLPLSATEFFVEQIQSPLAFQIEDGKVVGLVIFAGGQRIEGQRVGDLPQPAPQPAPAPSPK